MQKLLTLLQVNDSMFPIGSFTHSYGLESYVNAGIVHDNSSAAEYARTMLEHSIYYNDAAFLYRTITLPAGKKRWEQLTELDILVTALKAPYEIRDASKKLAIRFLKLVNELKVYPVCKKYAEAIQSGELHGHYAIAFGLYVKAAGISTEDALSAFYYNTLNGIITNCAKTVPISQTVGQKILFELQPVITKLVSKQKDMDEQQLGLCCIGQEIKCMQHEKLYTRIYIS
ncbi:urease accessory protein UreF [Chitinophaga nivalis]|uniref:Urease accessory protein UreF n=1 Tax=Chitinophaga nivalis TaxID=2991709 RepID=A0ABT3INT8_9BACT|nr:urease accessory protein UreF [Chitinophaga nivalis]MCW3464929.1 urease accessory protein UreF [Chitinophaga nivalis]MCW3485379.1 urease accessory protein UreF [Chitinophaga nivalis]